jgi:hypothetical protein
VDDQENSHLKISISILIDNMSEFNNDLFLEPKTTQYGSHMIMSNVHKTAKKKFISIDTRFRDEYNYSQLINYNITIPERITEVKTMKVVCAEIPISFYNISAALGNSFFSVTYNGTSKVVIVPDGQYDNAGLISAITVKLNALSLTGISCSTTVNYCSFTTNNTTILNFAVNSDGTNDKYNFKTKLGWVLGFRQPSYTMKSPVTSVTSEALIDCNGPRYLYLAIDEFNKGNQSSFIPPLYKSLVNKNIIARIALDKPQGFDFGKILPANLTNGLLVSDNRSYSGKIDLMKLNVQLLSENGTIMNLNGLDISFCLEITHE